MTTHREKEDFNFFLFEGFETLDAFGPVDVLGRIPSYSLHYYSLHGGAVINAQGVQVITEKIAAAEAEGILVIPGGMATRRLVRDAAFLEVLADKAKTASYVLSICTGSALLGAAGVLNGRRATSNKRAMQWVRSAAPGV